MLEYTQMYWRLGDRGYPKCKMRFLNTGMNVSEDEKGPGWWLLRHTLIQHQQSTSFASFVHSLASSASLQQRVGFPQQSWGPFHLRILQVGHFTERSAELHQSRTHTFSTHPYKDLHFPQKDKWNPTFWVCPKGFVFLEATKTKNQKSPCVKPTEVNSSSGILFRYPSSNILWSQSVPNPEVVEILIKGAKSTLGPRVKMPSKSTRPFRKLVVFVAGPNHHPGCVKPSWYQIAWQLVVRFLASLRCLWVMNTFVIPRY